MIPFSRTWADIDLGTLRENLKAIRSKLASCTRLGMVVKADAYGHGIVPIARCAESSGADWLCVATVQEGVTLHAAGIKCPILIISPMLPIELAQAVINDLRLTVESLETAKVISEAAANLGRIAKVHLEVDTGLARFGCKPVEALELARMIRSLTNIELEGLSQHFVDSGCNPVRTSDQLSQFEDLLHEFKSDNFELEVIHAANSAGATIVEGAGFDLVRVGILAYGIDPYAMLRGSVTPILRWVTRVTALRTLQAGETVGYAETWRAERPSVIATLGVGYGDGYPRALSSKGVTLLHGVECPVVGLVCMDMMMIDVTDVPHVQIGDEVELIGPDLDVVRLARLGNTITHEIITRIMARVPRRYLDASTSSAESEQSMEDSAN